MRNINDRGAKKWARLTIPEFKESLVDYYQEKVDSKSAKEIEKLETLLMIVSGSKTRVAINYNPQGTTYQINAYILYWDREQQTVDIINDYGEQKGLDFCYIENIEVINI